MWIPTTPTERLDHLIGQYEEQLKELKALRPLLDDKPPPEPEPEAPDAEIGEAVWPEHTPEEIADQQEREKFYVALKFYHKFRAIFYGRYSTYCEQVGLTPVNLEWPVTTRSEVEMALNDLHILVRGAEISLWAHEPDYEKELNRAYFSMMTHPVQHETFLMRIGFTRNKKREWFFERFTDNRILHHHPFYLGDIIYPLQYGFAGVWQRLMLRFSDEEAHKFNSAKETHEREMRERDAKRGTSTVNVIPTEMRRCW